MNLRKFQLLNDVYRTHEGKTWRREFTKIIDMIEENTTVLDLGCGDGTLGENLIKRKNCKVIGIDISEVAVDYARKKGIDARVGNIEEPLGFDNDSFDYVILCDVLEHLLDPMFTLKEALRVSKKYVIIAFPNFAYLPARFELMFLGRFPKYPLFGYNWYNSQHIRLFSFKDFINALKNLNFGVRVKEIDVVSSKVVPRSIAKRFPNIFASVCVLKLEKGLFDYTKVVPYKFDI